MRYLIPIVALATLAACNEPKGPTAAQRREALDQQYRDQLATEQRTLHVTDSLIAALLPAINEVTAKQFEYEKTEYDDLGRYRPKGTDPGDNVQRTYLHSAVDEYGRTQLIATYCGPKRFCVEQLSIKASDGTGVFTQVIKPNDGSNYQYDIDGVHYQSVTFAYAGRIAEAMTTDSAALARADTDNGALAFIAQNADDNGLKCWMVASDGKQQSLPISALDRQNMAATYELGVMLRESIRLQQENKTAALKIEYLQTKTN